MKYLCTLKNNIKMKNISLKKHSFTNYFSATLVAVAFLLSVNMHAQAPKKDKLLSEKNFDVELTEQGKKKEAPPVKDQILFRADRLSSTYMMREYVFTASAYTATADSTSGKPVITFVSDSKNADGDLLKWNGTVIGETMEGTAVMTDKKGKPKVSYTFKGQLKKFRGK